MVIDIVIDTVTKDIETKKMINTTIYTSHVHVTRMLTVRKPPCLHEKSTGTFVTPVSMSRALIWHLYYFGRTETPERHHVWDCPHSRSQKRCNSYCRPMECSYEEAPEVVVGRVIDIPVPSLIPIVTNLPRRGMTQQTPLKLKECLPY